MTVLQAKSFDVYIPQMGEGIREVVIISQAKRPGDIVRRDEVIYEMETEKAALEIESPEEGILDAWYVTPGQTVKVGSPIARLRSNALSVTDEVLAASRPAITMSSGNVLSNTKKSVKVPPRTVVFCKANGMSESEIQKIPSAKSTLDISDVELYLASKTTLVADKSRAAYTDQIVSHRQRQLNLQMERSVQTLVSASIRVHLDWDILEARTRAIRHRNGIKSLTEFQLLCYCICKAAMKHPKFRSTLVDSTTRREYDHINLGFAVALPDDDLVTAVVRDADLLTLPEFARSVMRQLRLARRGQDQASRDTHLTVSYLASHGVIDAQPVLVLPAAGTLFVGAPYQLPKSRVSNLVLAFDHRTVNGVGAANFLNEIKSLLDSIA